MTQKDLETKFIKSADRNLTRTKIDASLETMLHLENLESVSRLMESLSL